MNRQHIEGHTKVNDYHDGQYSNGDIGDALQSAENHDSNNDGYTTAYDKAAKQGVRLRGQILPD